MYIVIIHKIFIILIIQPSVILELSAVIERNSLLQFTSRVYGKLITAFLSLVKIGKHVGINDCSRRKVCLNSKSFKEILAFTVIILCNVLYCIVSIKYIVNIVIISLKNLQRHPGLF